MKKINLGLIVFMLFFGQCLCAQNEPGENDWANVARFRNENARLRLSPKNEKRVLFMGDSITENWIKFCPDFFYANAYINRGISGQTTPQILVRFRPDVIDLRPAVVVILAGTNDIAGNTGISTLEMIEDNLASMAELAKANGIKVILSSVLPVYDYPWRPGLNPAGKVASLNKWIENYAAENGFVYLDYYSSLADNRKGLKAAYTLDGVHPNKAGYKLMAPLAESAIARALATK